MKQIIKFWCLLVIFLFNSCQEKKIEYYSINIIQLSPIDATEGEPLDEGFKKLINYITDSANNNLVYIPKINVRRLDFSIEKNDSIIVPSNSINTFRKSMGMIAAMNIIEDYDEFVPTLNTPKILVDKGNKEINESEIMSKHPIALLIKIDDNFSQSLTNVYYQIKKGLENKKRKFEIIICNNSSLQTIDTIDEIKGGGTTKTIIREPKKSEPVEIPKDYSNQAKEIKQTITSIKSRLPYEYNQNILDIENSLNKLSSSSTSSTQKDKLLIEILQKLNQLIAIVNKPEPKSEKTLSPIAEQYYLEARNYAEQAKKLTDNRKEREKKKDLIHKAVRAYENAFKKGKQCKPEQQLLINQHREYFN